jgi:hypothetical protein
MEKTITMWRCVKSKNKKEPFVATTWATYQTQKGQKNSSYACHICGLNGHKMADCPKFVKMQKNFQLKNNASSSKGKAIVEVNIIIADVNVIDVNVATKSKITKDQVF